MLANRYLASCVSLAVLFSSQSPAASCPTQAVADLLQRADEARSWSEFWDDDDPGEALAELERALWLFGRAELMLVRNACLDAPDAVGLRLEVANGQRWARRFAAGAQE
jgi:hypothetical protein